MRITRFEDLEVWRTAMALAVELQPILAAPPISRNFAFQDQLFRASLSIVSNIAEGFESRTVGLYIELLGRAKASAGEARAQLHLARQLRYISDEQHARLLDLVTHCSSQLYNLMQSLEKHR